MPDIARDRTTTRIISGIELWDLEGIHNQRFECHACRVTLLPASYVKKVNKKRPYFRLFEYTYHDKNCGAERAKKAKGKARIQSVTTEEGFPYPYPNELVLDDDPRPVRVTVGGVVCPNIPWSVIDRPQGGAGASESLKRHNHTTRTIRPLAQTYIDFPHDRQYLQVRVPGVSGSNYELVFRYLFYTDGSSFSESKIFYGSIRFSRIRVQEDFAEVELSEGRWEKQEGRNTLVRPLVVRINTKGWPKLMRDSLLDEIEVTRKEIIEAHGKGDKKTKGWLFFIGQQDPVNEFLFHANDHRLICCIADVMEKKSRPVLSPPPNINNQPIVTAGATSTLHQPRGVTLPIEQPKKLDTSGRSAALQATASHKSNTADTATQAPHFPRVNPVRKFEVADDKVKEMPIPRETIKARVKSELSPQRVAATTDVAVQHSPRPATVLSRVKLWLQGLLGKS
ncbi:MAG TPA: hypothetical protein VF525_03770 [Pyrinomonadaceae bacterium]|jgi:hypothetical protein